jgi:hypothetical protein
MSGDIVRGMHAVLAGCGVCLVMAAAVAGCGNSDNQTRASVPAPVFTKPPTTTGLTQTDDDGSNGGNGHATSNEVSVGPKFAPGRPIDFGAAVVERSRSKELVVRNDKDGGQPARVLVNIKIVKIGGDKATDFAIIGGDCKVGLTLAPNATCTLEVRFTPAETGTRRAALTISVDPGSPASVLLTGTGGILPRGQDRITVPTSVFTG